MDPKRLIKLALPSKLVDALDAAVEQHSGYADRSQFVADAVASLLAELEVDGLTVPGAGATEQTRSPSNQPGPPTVSVPAPVREVEAGHTRLDLGDACVVAPPAGLPLAPDDPTPPTEVLWGMHNRDWPTLWAASRLAGASLRGPVAYKDWAGTVTDVAWAIAEGLQGSSWDTSGLPTNRAKYEGASSRFRTFFLGEPPASGPLFKLGLAAETDPGYVLLTRPGQELLTALAGLEPRKGRIRDDWRAAYLAHLATWVPVDFAFMRDVVGLIAERRPTRVELLEVVHGEHPEWGENVVATNVAGFISRGREWNLIEPEQIERRYVVVGTALEALLVAETEAKLQRQSRP